MIGNKLPILLVKFDNLLGDELSLLGKFHQRWHFLVNGNMEMLDLIIRDGNDLNLRQLDNISDAVLLVCRCTWVERTGTTRWDNSIFNSF